MNSEQLQPNAVGILVDDPQNSPPRLGSNQATVVLENLKEQNDLENKIPKALKIARSVSSSAQQIWYVGTNTNGAIFNPSPETFTVITGIPRLLDLKINLVSVFNLFLSVDWLQYAFYNPIVAASGNFSAPVYFTLFLNNPNFLYDGAIGVQYEVYLSFQIGNLLFKISDYTWRFERYQQTIDLLLTIPTRSLDGSGSPSFTSDGNKLLKSQQDNIFNNGVQLVGGCFVDTSALSVADNNVVVEAGGSFAWRIFNSFDFIGIQANY